MSLKIDKENKKIIFDFEDQGLLVLALNNQVFQTIRKDLKKDYEDFLYLLTKDGDLDAS